MRNKIREGIYNQIAFHKRQIEKHKKDCESSIKYCNEIIAQLEIALNCEHEFNREPEDTWVKCPKCGIYDEF